MTRLVASLACALALSACACEDEAAPAPSTPEAPVPEARPDDLGLPEEVEPDPVDLPGIQKRGELRVLVPGTEEDFLPRAGLPTAESRRLARTFAERQGLAVRFILVEGFEASIDALNRGVGDILAAQLTVTEAREEQVRFTRALFTADELLVAGRGLEDPPESTAQLAGREVQVRPGSAYELGLAALAANHPPGPKIVPVTEYLDPEEIAWQVSRGERPMTVLDSHMYEAIAAYNEDLVALFPIREGRRIAWAVRKDAPALAAALDPFIVEHALMAGRDARFTGDLPELKKRGVLRVLTRNNPVTYYLHRGEPRGFDYELARLAADRLGLRLSMVVVPSRDLLIPWLLEGRGDVIAASLTVTPKREQQVSFSEPYLWVEEVVLGPAGATPPDSVKALSGKVHVRASSSYAETLASLGVAFIAAPEDWETETLVAKVGRGEVPFTVADSHLAAVEAKVRDDVKPVLPLTEAPEGAEGSKGIAFAMRPGNEELVAWFDGFVKDVYRGLEFNMARTRYFESRRNITEAKEERAGIEGRISRWDALIQKYAEQYGLDWRLLAAQCWRESHFDPNAKSWVGAKGLLQVMPETGAAMGFRHLERPAQGVHAGVKYLDRLVDGLDSRIPLAERIWMGLAAYNVGLGHLADARRIARQRGYDPNRWFDHVERAMLDLEDPRFYRQARFGYARGSEPVDYVRDIRERYEAYKAVVPAEPK